jgi:hypothetical protein
MNRRVRGPYARWCESLSLSAKAGRAGYSIMCCLSFHSSRINSNAFVISNTTFTLSIIAQKIKKLPNKIVRLTQNVFVRKVSLMNHCKCGMSISLIKNRTKTVMKAYNENKAFDFSSSTRSESWLFIFCISWSVNICWSFVFTIL